MKEMFERQDNEKLCRKTKDMLKENSAFKESLCRKLDTKDEIRKVNKSRKNNNDNLKEKANSDSVVKVICLYLSGLSWILFGSYSHMLMNSDLSLMNSDLSPCLSINLYPHSYHSLTDQSYPHTVHVHVELHNHYIEGSKK